MKNLNLKTYTKNKTQKTQTNLVIELDVEQLLSTNNMTLSLMAPCIVNYKLTSIIDMAIQDLPNFV